MFLPCFAYITSAPLPVGAERLGEQDARGGVHGDARTLGIRLDLPLYVRGDTKVQGFSGFSHACNATTLLTYCDRPQCPFSQTLRLCFQPSGTRNSSQIIALAVK